MEAQRSQVLSIQSGFVGLTTLCSHFHSPLQLVESDIRADASQPDDGRLLARIPPAGSGSRIGPRRRTNYANSCSSLARSTSRSRWVYIHLV